jgi:hypothetical protein
MIFALSDEVWLATIALLSTIFTAVNVWVTSYITNQFRKENVGFENRSIASRSETNDKLLSLGKSMSEVYHNTNSIKDELVAKTKLAGELQGAKDERARAEHAAVVAAEVTLRSVEDKLQ